MKLMFAHCCSMLVVPHHIAENPRWCECKTCAVWWNDPRLGTLTCFGPSTNYISVIGINNAFLTRPFSPVVGSDNREEYGCLGKLDILDLIKTCPVGYLFKTVESNIIRVRADFHGIHGITLIVDRNLIPSIKS